MDFPFVLCAFVERERERGCWSDSIPFLSLQRLCLCQFDEGRPANFQLCFPYFNENDSFHGELPVSGSAMATGEIAPSRTSLPLRPIETWNLQSSPHFSPALLLAHSTSSSVLKAVATCQVESSIHLAVKSVNLFLFHEFIHQIRRNFHYGTTAIRPMVQEADPFAGQTNFGCLWAWPERDEGRKIRDGRNFQRKWDGRTERRPAQ